MKWKDTARTSKEITKSYARGVKEVVLAENALIIIEKELPDGLYIVLDSNPEKAERRRFKLKATDLIMENYSVTRDINVQILLADGWDSQELLREK